MTQTHEIVEDLPAEVDQEYLPKTHYSGRGSRVECDVCGAKGHSRGKWLDAHNFHVKCSCGKIVTKKGFGTHKASSLRHERKTSC